MTTAVLLLAMAALATRTVGYGAAAVAAGVGAIGLALPVRPAPARAPAARYLATPAGCVAVALVAAFGASFGASVRSPVTAAGVLIAAAAGIAEEALFRRALYAHLERFGPFVAVAVSAVCFALVHVPLYGWDVFAIDLAAGCVFGWQRWVTGGWTSPAVTHAFANVIGYL